MPPYQAWPSPPLSTDDPRAVARYRAGIAAIVAGGTHPERLLAEAIAISPGFLLARIGHAVAETIAGRRRLPPPADSSSLRGEQQHAEVVGAAFAGLESRCCDLRREHLLEYPGDILIVCLPILPNLG
jgi:hypothetical protein